MNEKKLDKIKSGFGKKVKELRELKNMTQLDLAIQVGVDVRQIIRIENSQVDTSLTKIYFIASALEVSVGDLFDFKA